MTTLLEVMGWLVGYVLLVAAAARWRHYQVVARRRQIERQTIAAVRQVQARYYAAVDAAIRHAATRNMSRQDGASDAPAQVDPDA